MGDIRISEKYGVNPSVMTCFFCGKADRIALLGHIRGRTGGEDLEAPRQAVYDQEPCPECKKLMEQGIIIIGVRDGEADEKNPYRTGQFIVVRESWFDKAIDVEAAAAVKKKRVCFMEESMLRALGFDKILKEAEDAKTS